MKILFDENIPRTLSRFLPTHEVQTTQAMGWARIENGELLDLAEAAGFDLLLTTDQNIPYQQKMDGRRIALVILRGKNNRLETLTALLPQVEAVLPALQFGQVYRIEPVAENTGL